MKNLDHCKLFAERLLLLRTEKNVTMEELYEATGIGMSTISQYETCIREPVFSNILKLMKYFNVRCDWLMGITDERVPLIKE